MIPRPTFKVTCDPQDLADVWSYEKKKKGGLVGGGWGSPGFNKKRICSCLASPRWIFSEVFRWIDHDLRGCLRPSGGVMRFICWWAGWGSRDPPVSYLTFRAGEASKLFDIGADLVATSWGVRFYEI